MDKPVAMTGKDLIFYILKNDLENELFSIPENIEFLTVDEYAVKLGMGIDSVKTKITLGILSTVIINGKSYILYFNKVEVSKDASQN